MNWRGDQFKNIRWIFGKYNTTGNESIFFARGLGEKSDFLTVFEVGSGKFYKGQPFNKLLKSIKFWGQKTVIFWARTFYMWIDGSIYFQAPALNFPDKNGPKIGRKTVILVKKWKVLGRLPCKTRFLEKVVFGECLFPD